jgi:hypothetical protein
VWPVVAKLVLLFAVIVLRLTVRWKLLAVFPPGFFEPPGCTIAELWLAGEKVGAAEGVDVGEGVAREDL